MGTQVTAACIDMHVNGVCKQVSGDNVTTLLVDSLTPFTNYSYRIEACTSAGCTSSNLSATVSTLTSSKSFYW